MKTVFHEVANYRDFHKRFPPLLCRDRRGGPLYSWRFGVFVLRFGEKGLNSREPWCAPDNFRPASFQNPDFCFALGETGLGRFDTNVVAVTGPGTPFGQPVALESCPYDVILFVEVAHSGVHWMEWGDITLEDMPDSIREGVDGDGFHAAFADGEVWFLSRDVPMANLRPFFTLDGAREHEREDLLGPYRR
jgi:hypothetical protein